MFNPYASAEASASSLLLPICWASWMYWSRALWTMGVICSSPSPFFAWASMAFCAASATSFRALVLSRPFSVLMSSVLPFSLTASDALSKLDSSAIDALDASRAKP